MPQWTEVLDGFCTEEFGVKTRQFHCCRRHGAARRRCFAQASAGAGAAVAATKATARVTTWDLVVEPPFPPGEPTATNIGNICRLRALRPGPVGPRGSSGPRGRMRLRLEREYGRCCRNASLACAHHAVSDAAGAWGARGNAGSEEGQGWQGGTPDAWGGDQGGLRMTQVLRERPRRPGWDPRVWLGTQGSGGRPGFQGDTQGLGSPPDPANCPAVAEGAGAVLPRGVDGEDAAAPVLPARAGPCPEPLLCLGCR